MFLGNSESSVKKATEQLASPFYRNTTVCTCSPVSQFLLVNIGSEAPNLQISLERLPINKRLTWKNAYFPGLGISAHFRSCSYATAVLLKTARRARSLALSSFLVTTALQKCPVSMTVGEIW